MKKTARVDTERASSSQAVVCGSCTIFRTASEDSEVVNEERTASTTVPFETDRYLADDYHSMDIACANELRRTPIHNSSFGSALHQRTMKPFQAAFQSFDFVALVSSRMIEEPIGTPTNSARIRVRVTSVCASRYCIAGFRARVETERFASVDV